MAARVYAAPDRAAPARAGIHRVWLGMVLESRYVSLPFLTFFTPYHLSYHTLTFVRLFESCHTIVHSFELRLSLFSPLMGRISKLTPHRAGPDTAADAAPATGGRAGAAAHSSAGAALLPGSVRASPRAGELMILTPIPDEDQDANLGRLQVSDVPEWALVLEGAWYAAVNGATMYVFLYFARDGGALRFMW